MILVFNQTDYTLLIGQGLIGSAILSALNKGREISRLVEVKFPWTGSPLNQQTALNKMLDVFKKIDPGNKLNVIWCAGKAGFLSDPKQTQQELQVFKSIVDSIYERTDSLQLQTRFVLISSAGGLHEGQRYIQPSTVSKAIRPYGELKQHQEEYLQTYPRHFELCIYRPSSVYGYITIHNRMGLVPTMVYNGLQQKTTQIYGHYDTLRDYIWIEDLATYIAGSIDKAPTGKPTILAATRPSTILEIKQYVESIIKRRISVVLLQNSANSSDITYSPHAVPANFQASDLMININKIYNRFISENAIC